jgi:hypothetical protein
MHIIPVMLETLYNNNIDNDNDIDYINMTVEVYETPRLSITTKENINDFCENKEFKNNFLNFWNIIRKKNDKNKNDIMDRLEKEITEIISIIIV